VSFSLSGADAAAFTIDSTTGAVTFNTSPDFETRSSYGFSVVASDGTLASAQAVTVSVTDVAPAITSTTSVSVPEGTSIFTIVYTATASDVQGGAVSFSLTGADAAAFTIDNASGAVTFNAPPDFETRSSYSFDVVASDGTLTSSQAVTVAVTDVAPAISSATSVTVSEGTSTSTVVYTAAANDIQGGAVSFSLTGADAAAFTIDGTTGAVTFNASPDFETKSSYSFNVKASDPSGAFNSQAVTVSVTDVAPTISSTTSVTVPEGTSTSTVVYTAAANDVQGGAVSFSLTGADAAAFTINNLTGAVTFNASPDFETKSAYTFNVIASDGTLTSAQAVTISISDVNEAPVLSAAIPDQSVPAGAAFSYSVPASTFTDPDGNPLAYSATLANGSPLPLWLTFNPGTGTFTGTPPAGFASIDIKVTASDGTFNVSDNFILSSAAASAPAAAAAPLEIIGSISGEDAPKPAAGSASSAPLPAIGSAPAAGSFDILSLTQPVDTTVPAARFNPNPAVPAASVPAAPDLNALPATAAGPSDLLGFPVERVSLAHAMQVPAEAGRDSSGFMIGGNRLFVYHGIPTLRLAGEDAGSIRVPEDAFAHTDPAAVVRLDARLIDGSPLPSWLKFDGTRGIFRGVPPERLGGSLEIEVIARDSDGREARASFVLMIEDLRFGEAVRAQDPLPDLMLGLDVDAKEAETARLKAQAEKAGLEAAKRAPEARQFGHKAGAGKPQIQPAASFSDQVRAAKPSGDPLLDRIAGRGSNGPGTRR
jgi:hypothetical protein